MQRTWHHASFRMVDQNYFDASRDSRMKICKRGGKNTTETLQFAYKDGMLHKQVKIPLSLLTRGSE